MLKCNLAVLLAERNLKITQVSNDTGISRTTLTSLVNNYSQGIQMDTLNKLCIYLQVTPDHFFSYIPFDIDIQGERLSSQDMFTVKFTFREKAKKEFKATLLCQTIDRYETFWVDSQYGSGEEKSIINLELFLTFFDATDQINTEAASDIEKENQIFKKFFKQLSVSFIRNIESDLINEILSCMGIDEPGEEFSPEVTWPSELD